jgi:hypothetical protein
MISQENLNFIWNSIINHKYGSIPGSIKPTIVTNDYVEQSMTIPENYGDVSFYRRKPDKEWEKPTESNYN